MRTERKQLIKDLRLTAFEYTNSVGQRCKVEYIKEYRKAIIRDYDEWPSVLRFSIFLFDKWYSSPAMLVTVEKFKRRGTCFFDGDSTDYYELLEWLDNL